MALAGKNQTRCEKTARKAYEMMMLERHMIMMLKMHMRRGCEVLSSGLGHVEPALAVGPLLDDLRLPDLVMAGYMRQSDT